MYLEVIQLALTLLLLLGTGWYIYLMHKLAQSSRQQVDAAVERLELARVQLVQGLEMQKDTSARMVGAVEASTTSILPVLEHHQKLATQLLRELQRPAPVSAAKPEPVVDNSAVVAAIDALSEQLRSAFERNRTHPETSNSGQSELISSLAEALARHTAASERLLRAFEQSPLPVAIETVPDRLPSTQALVHEIDQRLLPDSDRSITYFSRLCGIGPAFIDQRQADELEQLTAASSDPQERAIAAAVVNRMRELLKLGAAAQQGSIATQYSDAATVLVENAARELRSSLKQLMSHLRPQAAAPPKSISA